MAAFKLSILCFLAWLWCIMPTQAQDDSCDSGSDDVDCGDPLNTAINGAANICNEILTECPGGFPAAESELDNITLAHPSIAISSRW